MSDDYRWNQAELAAAYDADAPAVHPHYSEVQDVLLTLLEPVLEEGGTVVDLGAGSGRLAERILERFSRSRVILLDQSEAFLDIARRRLAHFGERADCLLSRLQTSWSKLLPGPADAIVSMSAIHHLEPLEKQACFREAAAALRPEGLFANGDEVRAESDADYRRQCTDWAAHMQRLIDERRVTAPMAGALEKWIARNVTNADAPRRSGDDCHETAPVQLGYFEAAGFSDVQSVWSRGIWTVLAGRRRTNC